MQHNYSTRYLVTNIDEKEIKVYKYDKCKVQEAFLMLKARTIITEESPTCTITEVSGFLIVLNLMVIPFW